MVVLRASHEHPDSSREVRTAIPSLRKVRGAVMARARRSQNSFRYLNNCKWEFKKKRSLEENNSRMRAL